MSVGCVHVDQGRAGQSGAYMSIEGVQVSQRASLLVRHDCQSRGEAVA